MNKLIEDYNKAIQAIYEHVGFRDENYGLNPIEDYSRYTWKIVPMKSNIVEIRYGESNDDFDKSNGYYYEKFSSSKIYVGEDFTLGLVNDVAYLFDNSKKQI